MRRKLESVAAVDRDTRVLIVDGHRPSLVVLHISLQMRGFACECAETADDAVACVGVFVPDVVIYEWRMLGGIGLARRLRTACRNTVVVIALSTQDEPDGFRDLEQVDEYVRKPYDLASLERSIARIRERSVLAISSMPSTL